MGCPNSKQNGYANQVDHNSFLNTVKRLSTQLQMQMNRFRLNQIEQIQRFKKEVTKDEKRRENYVEQELMEKIVFLRDMQTSKVMLITVYKQIMIECKKVIDNQHLLSLLLKKKRELQSQNQRKAVIMAPIQVILFSRDIISVGSISQKSNELQTMQQLIKTKYSEVTSIKTTQYELINHYQKHRRPNSQMIREWLFGFCVSQNISLSAINKAGHNISY